MIQYLWTVSILSTDIEFLKGVGPSKGKLLREELGISTFYDLLHHFPFRYIDKSVFSKIRDIRKDTEYIQLVGVLNNVKESAFKGRTRLSASFKDDTGMIELVWFQGASWMKDLIKRGATYKLYGKVNYYRGKRTIAHPELELYDPNKMLEAGFEPVYSTTEKLRKKSLDSRGILQLQKEVIKKLTPYDLEEFFPKELVFKQRLIDRRELYQKIHFPSNKQHIAQARYRIKFEDFFIHQMSVLKIKLDRYNNTPGPKFESIKDNFNTFFHDVLPYELTGAQKRVLKEIRFDVAHGRHMNRLLQGDVGSGKTIVALMTALMSIDNGFQVALMAPTEILAQQHFAGISELLETLSIQVGLLTGSIKGEKRKNILTALKTGHIDLLIGTHALIEDPVQFENLGIAIIDEQHRFGVAQRAKLWNKRKGEAAPHILVMTATPIPRTLAMTSMGDLDVSVIDELPPGRKPVKTIHKDESYRLRLQGFMKEEIEKGRQIYVVYPLIEESEKLDLKDLFNGFNDLQSVFPYPKYRTSVLNGRMKPAEKEADMRRFVDGETQIMVATTVIEVGVNVPNASVMIIENAERFGLAQLHQLRGRVGRGADQSYCILMTKSDLSDYAKKRMDTMVRTTDGFEIAQADLELRGPGDIEGTRQSGMIQFRMADLVNDPNILQRANEAALELLEDDADLSKAEHQPLRTFLSNSQHLTIWSKIS